MPTSAPRDGSGAMPEPGSDGAGAGHEPGLTDRVLVVTPEGMSVADVSGNPAQQIEEPAKVMRIGSMIKQLLEEVRSAPLDDAGRARLADIHERSLAELEKGLAPELAAELRSMAVPFDKGSVPSDSELRIAQAQLVGWLEGLFHGIQAALVAQQMAARMQIEQMRRALPGAPGEPPPPSDGVPQRTSGTGQYL